MVVMYVMQAQSACSRQLARSASMRRINRMFQEKDSEPAERLPRDSGPTNIINVEPAPDRIMSVFLSTLISLCWHMTLLEQHIWESHIRVDRKITRIMHSVCPPSADIGSEAWSVTKTHAR